MSCSLWPKLARPSENGCWSDRTTFRPVRAARAYNKAFVCC